MALDPIAILFHVGGLAEVNRAFAGVEQQIARMEKNSAQSMERSSKSRVRSANTEAKDRERAAAKISKDAERLERQHTREVEKESKRREGIVRKSSEMTGRMAQTEAREEARAQAERTRTVEREAERRMRIQIRSSEMAGRAAARAVAEEEAAQSQASRRWGRAGRRAGGVMAGSVGRLASSVGSIVGATAGIGGGMLLADAFRREGDASRTAALLVNAGTNNGVAPGTVSQAIAAARAESIKTGMSSDVLLQGALTYSQNARGGDFKGALANMPFFAKMSRVTGADINDIASAAGTLQSQNKELQDNPAAMQQLLLNTLAQAHQGSMSMVDAAKQFGILGSTRSSFAGDVTKNQQTLVGLGQIARAGGDAGEAGTFVKDIALESTMAAKRFKKEKGKDLFKTDQFGRIASPESLISDVIRNTGGNIQEINHLFGIRGGALFRELEGSYIKGAGPKNNVDAGIAAVQANMREVTGATMTTEQLEAQDKTVLDQPAEKFKIALNKVIETIEQKLEPRMAKLADKMPQLADKIGAAIDEAAKFADWFADNPIKGIGAVVLAAITKDLAMAGIGAAVKAAMMAMMQGVGAGGGLGGAVSGAGGIMGNLGKAGLVGAAGVAGAAVGFVISDAVVDAEKERMNANVAAGIGTTNMASALFGKARAGKVTAKDVTTAQEELKSAGADLEQKKAEAAHQKDISWVPGSDFRQARANEEAKSAQISFDLLNKALTVATAKLEKLGSTAANTQPGAPNRNVPLGSAAR